MSSVTLNMSFGTLVMSFRTLYLSFNDTLIVSLRVQKKYGPQDTGIALWEISNVLETKNVFENINKVHQEKSVILDKSSCDDGVVKQKPVMKNGMNDSGLVKAPPPDSVNV